MSAEQSSYGEGVKDAAFGGLALYGQRAVRPYAAGAADGKNACQKIASLLGKIIQDEIEKNTSCCCECCAPCCKKTLEITAQSVKVIIDILPTVVQLVVAIMTATA